MSDDVAETHLARMSTRGARYITDFDGRYIFCKTFHVDSKNNSFFKIGHTQLTPMLCPACLLSFDEQPGWAELGRRLGVTNLKKIIFLESS